MNTVEKINAILDLINQISEEDKVIGEIFFVNYKSSINTIAAISKGNQSLDIDEQLILLSDLLNINLEEVVKYILEKDYINNQSGEFVNAEEADQSTIDFIVGNSKNINNTNNDIDDYEKFLAQTKEDMEFLKGEI